MAGLMIVDGERVGCAPPAIENPPFITNSMPHA